MANFKIKKGFDVKVEGKPSGDIEDYADQQLFAVYPSEFEGLKPRLKVKAGDSVKRGDVLFENKKNEKMFFDNLSNKSRILTIALLMKTATNEASRKSLKRVMRFLLLMEPDQRLSKFFPIV